MPVATEHLTKDLRPVCSKCQTPMVRYNVPHTGDREQAWRLACSCKHAAVSEVIPSKTVTELCRFCDLPIAPGERRPIAIGGYGHDYEAWCIRALRQEIERLRARLQLETAALELSCAAPIEQPITVAAARSAVETTTVIDLNAVMWEEIRDAILNSPRFAEMYAAGGVFQDGISNVIAWLKEPPQETTVANVTCNS